MELRGTVKIPQRLEDETAYEKNPRQVRRRAKDRAPRQYIDWNPNLPPAAFPTLERPRTRQKVGDRIFIQDRTIHPDHKGAHETRSQDGGTRNGSDKTKKAGVRLSALISDSFENSVASNGDLNPIYEKNMAQMTNEGEESASVNQDMEDSDVEHTTADDLFLGTPKEAIPIPNPKWNELSPRIQVEIFSNLLHDYSSSLACEILDLTDTECERTQMHMAQRERQTDMEDSQLVRMREDQLKSLLKIDNSDLKNNRIPHRLIFRRTSRKYGRKLGRALKMNFFSCHVGELENAQRFLNQRGLDMGYSGEWSNGMSVWKGNRDYKTKKDITQTALPSPSINASASGSFHYCFSSSIPKRQGSDIKYPGQTKDLFMRQGEPKLVSEQLIASCRQNMEDKRREPLHGSDTEDSMPGATLLRDSEYSCIEPLKLVKTLPPIIRWYYSEPPLRYSIPKRPANPAFRQSSMPITASSLKMKQKLEIIRAEALKEKPEAGTEENNAEISVEEDIDDDWSSTCSLPIGQATLVDDRSQMTSPGRIIRDKSPEIAPADNLFPLEDMNETQVAPCEAEDSTTSTNCKVRATPGDGSEYSCPPSPSPSSLGCNNHVPSMTSYVESSPGGDCADDDGEFYMDEDNGDDDEMVLVPIGPRRTTI